MPYLICLSYDCLIYLTIETAGRMVDWVCYCGNSTEKKRLQLPLSNYQNRSAMIRGIVLLNLPGASTLHLGRCARFVVWFDFNPAI